MPNDALFKRVWPAMTHGANTLADICRGLIFQRGMYTDGCEKIRVGDAKNGCHRTACRDTSCINACSVNCPCFCVLLDFLYNTDNTGRFTTTAHLMRRKKPVPA